MTPDALKIPQGLAAGRTFRDRLFGAVDLAERLLGVDRPAGGRAFVRPAAPGSLGPLFCTRDPNDTEFFPVVHPRSGQPRYRWEPGPDGVQLGFLVGDPDAD